MWIRSQDRKTIINADKVNLKFHAIHLQGTRERYELKVGQDTLAFYDSEKKALNVLDDMTSYLNCYHDNFVYEMPTDIGADVVPKTKVKINDITQMANNRGFYVKVHLCPNCGREIEDYTRYCCHCGVKLDWTEIVESNMKEKCKEYE